MFDENHGLHSMHNGHHGLGQSTELRFTESSVIGSSFGFGHVFFWIALAGVAFIAWRMYMVVSGVGSILSNIPPA